MTPHILDRPVWTALATRHGRFALGGDRARRFVHDVGPLAASRDDEPESLAALAELVPADGAILLLQAEPIALPSSLVAPTAAMGVQLVLERLVDVARDPRIVALTGDDVPAMVALATATKPGPFAKRTNELGQFFGVKDGDVLVAMAGERLAHAGFAEVSGVCTHPEARGRGLARSLSAHVARQILARGETPYLHAYASNAPAIALYESLGFRLRCAMHVATVARASS
jgi:predicted GNAT family acetyltransferase